jgi:hypothetical protein
MCCHVLGFSYPILYLHLFKASLLSHLQVFALHLSGFFLFFMSEMIDLHKLFAKLGCCRILCSFLSDQVVNYSQCSLTMLSSKL